MRAPRVHGIIAGAVFGLTFVISSSWHQPLGEAATVARVSPSGDAIEIEHTAADGVISRSSIPVHRAGEIRYFSAGVGLEEREVEYPPFPLKLIFVAGPRPYLSHVAVTVTDSNGTEVLRIPDDRVTGPWLFVELPAGRYEVTARRRDGRQVTEHVQVPKTGTKVAHLRWPAP
jgi:hypothetical protein